MTTPPVARQPWPISAACRRDSASPLQRVLRILPGEFDSAERNAEACVTMFLASAMDPWAPSTQSLDALLYARGALNAAAERSALGRAARSRLELRLIRALTGSTRRHARSWRHTMREIEATPEGEAICRRGHAALRAWLRGRPPEDHSSWSGFPRAEPEPARSEARKVEPRAHTELERVSTSSRDL